MKTAADFERKIAENWPPARWADESVVVAVSGGADSTAMLRALVALRPPHFTGKLIAAHLNHGLRGAESDGDEAFVVALAGELQLECCAQRIDVAAAAAERGDGVEEAARSCRYDFLVAAAQRYGARYVATAHTLDDQAETVLLRILRGTGLAGLAGIPRVRGLADGTIGLVRPLINVRRAEVLEYLAALGQTFRTDSSNQDGDYTRNRVRNDLLPRLAEEYNPRIVESLANLASQANDLREVFAPLVEELPAAARFAVRNNGFELGDCAALRNRPKHLVREALVAAWTQAGLPLQAMGYEEWNALAEMVLVSMDTKRMFPGGVTAERQGNVLTIGK